ncbi:cytochrome P450, partial [Rhizopogon vinicolor AM-OR11-026]
GPRPLPFLGNALHLDAKQPWVRYTAWGKTYIRLISFTPFVGELIYSRVLGIDMITINSETAARELLDKRSAIYSIVRRNWNGFQYCIPSDYETLQRHRKVYHQALRAEASISYHEMSSRKADELILNPTVTVGTQKYIHVFAGSLIMTVTYGHIAYGDKDPFLTRARELINIAIQIISPEKAAIITAFPFCEQKTQLQSLVTGFLSQVGDDADEDMMKDVTLTGYPGKKFPRWHGDGECRTFWIPNRILLYLDIAQSPDCIRCLHIHLAMVLYPDVQGRPRAEVNQVVKHDKIPSIDDRVSLPYLDAVVFEVLRWHPPVTLGQSAVIKFHDDVYNGYFIPKGSKSYEALSRDKEMFPDVSRFDPSRHLTIDEQLKNHVVNHFAFGHG